MTIVPIAPVTNVPSVPYPFVPPPFTDVAPLTYRDGTTYLEYLRGLNNWIQNVLIPYIDNNLTELGQNYLDVANNLINEVNAALASNVTDINALVDTINAAITSMNSAVTEAQTYANNSATSATDSANSASASQTSATDSATSAVNAETSASASASSAGDAETYANNAKNSVFDNTQVDARYYGVVVNGPTDSASLTANTTAFQAFVDTVQSNNLLGKLPSGEIHINGTIVFANTPQWGVWGAGKRTTIIVQHADNTKIFDVGAKGASQMHNWQMRDFGFTYANAQPSSNTNAICLNFSATGFQFDITSVDFNGGFLAIGITTGTLMPWGGTWDNLEFSNQSGAAMDWSNSGASGVPNNHWGRFEINMGLMTLPYAINNIRGYNFIIDTLEFLDNANGIGLMQFAAGSIATIGAVKLEVATFSNPVSTTVAFISFANGGFFRIGQLKYANSAPSVFNAAGNVYAIWMQGANPGHVIVDNLNLDAFVTSTGTGFLGALASANQAMDISSIVLGTGWNLTNGPSAQTSEYVNIAKWNNGKLSQNKGDSDYVVTPGDPTIISYETAFTANHSLTIPGTSNNFVFNGWKFRVRVKGKGTSFSLAIYSAENNTLLYTIPAGTDNVIIEFTYRRNASHAYSGWIQTGYEVLQ